MTAQSSAPVEQGHQYGQRFAGKAAIITGASRGIGLAIAARIVHEGGRVVVTARKPEGLADHQADALEHVVREFGRLDVLVNNTGINPAYGPLTQIDESAARKIMDVNVLAALSWTRRALDAGLGADGHGAVVNIASVAGLHPSPGIGYYGVSKSALIGLTMQLAAELAPRVRVNAVAPAVVKTRFAAALYEQDEAKAASAYPLGRLGEPEDVAAAAAFLASGDAAWLTGQTLVVDGGLSLRASL
jgi:NAD(P)-dependent dehydrogenase (short-subunit alcohol dehydrogenase family)